MRHKIGKIIQDRINYKKFFIAALSQSKEETKVAKKNKLPELSKLEKNEIQRKWGQIMKRCELGYSGYQVYKSFYGFDVNYLPFSYFFPWMLRKLNPIEYSHVYSNKGLSYNIFPTIKQPELIARKVNGCIFSSNGDIISFMQLISNIINLESDLIVKKSTDSCCGRNIAIIKKNVSEYDITNILKSFESDYIIQRIVKQSFETAIFNPSSLNTMRISTLFLNGKISICTAMVRFGLPNSVVDNVGAGGCCVGINDDGSFMEFGFNNQCEKIISWNGVIFKGHKITDFDKVIEVAKKAHHCIPQCQFAGWDLAIDENGEVVLIEVNLIWPGLFFEQLANGKPALRGREKELLDYLKKQPLPYGNPT